MGYVPLILVVEDNEMNRELIREILLDEGYRIKEAHNGKEGVDKALEETPDVILMDIEMPVMTGLEATSLLTKKSQTSRVPIIVLTGLNETEDRIKAFDCGAMDYLTKPFNAHELLARVNSYIRFSLLNKKYVLSTVSQETGLPNRAAFLEKLPDTNTPKLLLIKIDNIESISRFYGESTGTEIEKNFSRFLLAEQPQELKENGTLFHLGRGLFGILMDDPENSCDKNKGIGIASHLQERYAVQRSATKEAHYDIEFTIVLGFDRENMLEKTELALDEALRNQTALLVMDDMIQDVYQAIGENIFWLKKIKEAIQDDRLLPYYQPIFNSATGKKEKYEALVRMIDKNGEVVPPGKFLFIAKNSKYYPDITKVMVQKAMCQFRNRKEEFALNLSAMDIENKNMRDYIFSSLQKLPDTASRLTLEIVEQEGAKYIDILKDFVRQVKQYGVKIAIDDFGSGYSNFRMLLDMEADYLKIDGSLIRNIHEDAASRNVVETIKAFADKTNIGIVAEFVSNKEIYETLKNMGIQYFQGYYFGKPEPM
jgi:c-di-GMP phosphodiesterase